ncbi:MAG TPA: SAM-dependent methyltransferase [Thermoleophilaceae bacterium]
MRPEQPSATARGAAAHRAAHQVLEGGAVFSDPLADALLDQTKEEIAAAAREEPALEPMRLFVAKRARVAEDALARAFARGVRQAVVLGAGLDTFGLRNPHDGLQVFEVDHPATQAWKRERIDSAGLEIPRTLRFAPIDFERQALGEALGAAGFHEERAAFFTWLGVVPYLTREAIEATLAFIGSLENSEVVLDYGEPLDDLPAERRPLARELAERVADAGEPLTSHFKPSEMAALLERHGFTELDDSGFRLHVLHARR